MAFALGTARDPGLQPERTSLAWTRTALAVLLNALVALRGAWIDGSAMLLATGAMLALAACALYGYGVHRGRVLLACEGQVPHPAGLARVAALVLLACATGVAGVAWHLLH
ncbi:DUF202 domain-containing protein [Acidovorax sp. Root217]|uniref:DUF202 domain-containing protein n=1 Tax=Acidovorax sp. Root217 TaxID=1736492 RepID=UPI00070AC9CD|nr:DUF202 domain-containing protein [Acidovorax sp. Root217]KRC24763.1 hypothetical protein ASE31_20015 [Acidovorax sp. Root217]